MQSDKSTMAGGIMMLIGLVVMLTVPMILGHFVLPPAGDTVQHADAGAPIAN